ncbi:MAG: hypothetical protein U0Q20_07850 [Mycobacterium sp.]
MDRPHHHIRSTVSDATPEIRYRDPLAAHLADASAVEPYASLSTAWLALRARWADFTLTSRPCRDALVKSLVDGDSDPAPLFAQALAEESATNGDRAEVLQHVAAGVCGALTRLYQPAAAKNYRTVAAAFDTAAKQHDHERLDELLPALCAAARLCGADQDVAHAAADRLALGLTIDPGRAHLRHIAAAFTAPDRWHRIPELGARVRAAADPLTEYPTMPALIRCVDRDRRLTWHDPLDGKLPTGWRPALDGWLDEAPAFIQ